MVLPQPYVNLSPPGQNVRHWQQPSVGLDNGLAANRREGITGNNADTIYWRIYAALGGDELKG